MSNDKKNREQHAKTKESRERVEKATSKEPESILGSGAPASGNPGTGNEAGKYEE